MSGAHTHTHTHTHQLHSCQDVLSSQLENAVVALLSNFLSDDLTKLDQMKEAHENSRQGIQFVLHCVCTFLKCDTARTGIISAMWLHEINARENCLHKVCGAA